MNQEPSSSPEAIYQEARKAREGTEALQPLLSLLEEPETGEPSPVDELRDLLEVILLSQRQLHLLVEDLSGRVDAIGRGRRSRSGTFSARTGEV